MVDGGPGTGKTVVALHRCAYLLYSEPRLGHRRGGVLFVGPHQPYLAYVADVLPSLGEEGVQTCTLRDLVPEGAAAAIETDPNVAHLKSSADLVKAIEPAVRFYEEPPTEGMTVTTDWSDIWLSADDWADAFDAAEPVDEAQELTDAQWQMLLIRCPSRSFTIVGDRAQARHGFTESWQERLERIGLDLISLASLSINYRTPQEVMAEAEPVIRAVLPDANVPTSIRSSGVPVEHGSASELGTILDTWLAAHTDGIAAVISRYGQRLSPKCTVSVREDRPGPQRFIKSSFGKPALTLPE